MKKNLILISATVITSALAGQNVLILKTGEKMKGKVERFRNDTLTFNFKGNKMQLKSSEIVSIYFDEKDVPEEQPNTSVQIIEQQQEGKITGVVTYFFNDNYGDKPDLGAEVLIIDVLKVNDFKLSTVDSFSYANTYKNLYNSYAARGNSEIPERIRNEVKAYGVDTNEGFDALDKRTENELDKIRFNNIIYCTKLVVDGNGTFSSSFPPGSYYVYVKSNNRKGASMTELFGKIYCAKVIVKSGETSNIDARFGLN